MHTNFSNSKYFSKIAIIKSLTITNYSFTKYITTTRKNHSKINPSHIYTYIVIYTHIFEKKSGLGLARRRPPGSGQAARAAVCCGPKERPCQDWPRHRCQGPAEQPPPGPGHAEPPPAGLGCASRQIWPRRAAARRAGPRLPPDLATPGRHPPGLAAPPAGAGHARPGRTSRQS